MATEACGGGTPDLGYFLEVSGFIGEVGDENKSGGAHGESTRQGGAPSTLVVALGHFWSISGTPWASSGPKTISVNFQVNWTPFGFPCLRYSKTRKN